MTLAVSDIFRVPDGEASRRAGCGKSARPVHTHDGRGMSMGDMLRSILTRLVASTGGTRLVSRHRNNRDDGDDGRDQCELDDERPALLRVIRCIMCE
jgi:hypothetical protein